MAITDEAKNITSSITNYLNIMGCDNQKKEFIKAMSREHRALQEEFSELCFAWIAHCSELKDNEYDARNEGAVKVSKEILKKYPDFKYFLLK